MNHKKKKIPDRTFVSKKKKRSEQSPFSNKICTITVINRKIAIKERTDSSTTNDATTINSHLIDRKI
jgi:hypothetical protein